MRVGGPPGDVCGDVPVLVEGSEGDEGSPDVPDIDSEVNTEGATAEIVSPLRSPLDPADRSDGVDCVVQPVHLVPLPADGVPHLDGLVPASSGEDVPELWVPVTGEDVIVVSGPLLLTPVTGPPRVPQLDLPVL